MTFVEVLKNRLAEKLPGPASQQKMAPSIRNIEALWKKTKPELKNAAVLIPLFFDKQWKTVLIKRQEYNGPHSNQVSFPGGIMEESDESLTETALREAWEETGIITNQVEVLGFLSPLFIPVSNKMVQPVVGYLAQKPHLIADPVEVKEIIVSDLLTIVKTETRKTETIMVEDRYIDAPYFDINNHHVWGATAMMLSEFCDVIYDINFQKLM